MARYGLALVAVFLAAGFLGACEKKSEPTVANDRSGRQELLIGLIPEQNIFRQRERYMALRKYLSDRLGITVNFTSLSEYGNIIERFTAEKMDGAFFGSFTYVLAHHQIGVEPLARPVNLDGTATYHGCIFVRQDSGIRRAADMRGKRFAFVERATMAGYLYPLAWFRENGIRDPHAYLAEIFFAGSHDAAIEAVLNGEAEIGAAKNTIYEQVANENSRVRKELVIVAASDVVPQNCLAVRRNLDPELKQRIRKILIGMDKDKAGREVLRRFGALGFIETSDGDFAYVVKLTKSVGINLKTYRLANN
jgi:phosphonate transport system substrate-binding protein